MTDVPLPEQEPTAGQVFRCDGPEERSAALTAATAAIRRGACVVLPTDTVYGIGADAFAPAAVQGLLDAKGRGRDMPPPVLIGDPAVLMALGRDIPDAAKKLAERFWPGALTLILQAQPSLAMDLGDTQGTIAVRVPDHEFARELLRATGPLAVSSANRTGAPAATSAAAAREQLGDRVAVYLDDGATPGPEPSTIVDFTASDYGVVVRDGRVTIDELRDVVPYLEARAAEDATEPAERAAEDATEPAPEDATESAEQSSEGGTEPAERVAEGGSG